MNFEFVSRPLNNFQWKLCNFYATFRAKLSESAKTFVSIVFLLATLLSAARVGAFTFRPNNWAIKVCCLIKANVIFWALLNNKRTRAHHGTALHEHWALTQFQFSKLESFFRFKQIDLALHRAGERVSETRALKRHGWTLFFLYARLLAFPQQMSTTVLSHRKENKH